MTTPPIELEARAVWYGSQLDEYSFFGWLKKIPAVITYFGQGHSLYIQCDPAPIDDESLRELIALFFRYGIDTAQLDVYLTDANRSWFADEQKYWRQPEWAERGAAVRTPKVPDPNEVTPDHETYVRDTLAWHLRLGGDKPVSYLPRQTIERVLAMPASAYRSMIEAEGLKCVEVPADVCCIISGAVYAYDEEALRGVLDEHREPLSAHGWPLDPEGFIRRMARVWLDHNDPAMPAVLAAFGD